MAIRKNNSRAADRVKIKRMHAQGYDNNQIAMKLSITSEHIEYVLTEYENALARNIELAQAKLDKTGQEMLQARATKEVENFREAEAIARRVDPSVPAPVDREAMKAELLAEIRAELLAETPVAVEETPVAEAEVEDQAEAEEEAPTETHTTKRRRRKAA